MSTPVIQQLFIDVDHPDTDGAVIEIIEGVPIPGPAGPAGPAGPEGPAGPAGPPGEKVYTAPAYEHTQLNSPSKIWVITHNLGFKPAGIHVTDGDGVEHEPTLAHASENTLMLYFYTPTAGTAIIS